MFSSPFGDKKEGIPEWCDIVFVSDMFVEDYVGGAELTSQALIDSCPLKIHKIHSKDVNLETLEQGHKKYWIFGNFASLNLDLIPTITSNMSYSVLEYDYKFCVYRSPEKHKTITGNDCNCHEEMQGKLVSAFLYGANSLWWMSEKQQEIYHNIFPFLEEKESVVLSSVFDDTFFAAVKLLREKYKDNKREGWIVLGSTSWIKGADDAESWCKDNSKKYEVVWNIPYAQVLEKLAVSEGFVYLPKGGDTCPRMVIEAKLLGCKLHLNDNVQHCKEVWFDTEDMFDTEAYLYAARERFWNAIQASMNYIPKISGYTTTLDCIKHNYPFEESIESLLGFCSEIIVVDGGSTDGTWEKLKELRVKNEKIKIMQHTRDWKDSRFAVFDGLQKATARNYCTGDYCWQQDADEVVHENDYEKIIQLCRNFPKHADLISLPVVEYWGSHEKVRVDVNPWKWRLSRNLVHITHGIPKELRLTDEEDKLYALPGTDGCDYVHRETFERIPHASFYTGDVHQARIAALSGNKEALSAYQEWFDRTIESLPGVHHYSWIDIERKIKTYRDYWSKHWQSLYDISQEDTSENNMFFNKKWSDVTEEEIKNRASELASKLGGWVFHNKVDFSKPTPHIKVATGQPRIMVK